MNTTEYYWRKFPLCIPECRCGFFLTQALEFDGKITLSIRYWQFQRFEGEFPSTERVFAWCPIPVDGDVPLPEQFREEA